jgi:hypothetical protein
MMKFKPIMLAAIAATSVGLLTTVLDTSARADRPGHRPGYHPGRMHPGGGGGGRPHPGAPVPSSGTSGQLKGEVDEQILVYPQPDSESDPIGYGFSGDSIVVYDNFDGGEWYYVQFSESGARGWIQGEYVEVF